MCLEDVRIGKATTADQNQETVGTTSTNAIPQNVDRFALVLCPPNTGTITFSVQDPAVANEGIVIAAGGAPVVLSLPKHGALVTKGWFAIGSGAGVKAIWIQSVFYERGFIDDNKKG